MGDIFRLCDVQEIRAVPHMLPYFLRYPAGVGDGRVHDVGGDAARR